MAAPSRGYAIVGVGFRETRVLQKFAHGLEKFRCRVRRGAIDPVRLVRAALRHAVLSYMYGALIIATTINLIAGLGK